MSSQDALVTKLNTWAKTQDIERAYFFMSGYGESMTPLYQFVVVRKEGCHHPLPNIIDALREELSESFSTNVTVAIMPYCTDMAAKKTGAIPHYAIKIVPPASGRFRL